MATGSSRDGMRPGKGTDTQQPESTAGTATSKGEFEKTDGIKNIFDTVFRTIVEFRPKLIIPVINEIFHTSYTADGPFEVIKNEHVSRGRTIITDLAFLLENRIYHVELQSVTDNEMIIRIIEYAAAIAIERAVKGEDGSYRMKFPNSCVIYVRSTKNTPDKLTMHLDFQDGRSITFDAPVLKVKDYTKDALFQKDLIMLLPYYLMRYEKDCKEAGGMPDPDEADRRMDTFVREYKDICDRLLSACRDGNEQGFLYTLLAEQIKEIAEYLAPENAKERVVAMGGTIIKPQAQIILEQGIEQGIEKGIEQGIEQGQLGKAKSTAIKLSKKGMPIDEISDVVEYGVENISQWLTGDAAIAK